MAVSFSVAMARQLLIRPWTIDDDAKLRRLWGQNLTARQIAARMSRARATIVAKAAQLDLPPRTAQSVHRFPLPTA
jgi:hypothetical protein